MGVRGWMGTTATAGQQYHVPVLGHPPGRACFAIFVPLTGAGNL